jgi:hypothetical protein
MGRPVTAPEALVQVSPVTRRVGRLGQALLPTGELVVAGLGIEPDDKQITEATNTTPIWVPFVPDSATVGAQIAERGRCAGLPR